MPKQISSKIVALTFGILAVAFLAVFYVVAWTEPTQAPPGGNVATPINVGSTAQSKVGGLILNTGDATHLPATNGLIIDNGNLCLGTDCKNAWPAAAIGLITTYRMTVSSYQVGDRAYYGSKTVSYTCPDGGTPVVTYCKSIAFGSGNACNCSGSVLKAYVKEYENGSPSSVVDFCQPRSSADYSTSYSCGGTGPCEIEFQCGKKETVGIYTPTPETCLYGATESEENCDQATDIAYCSNGCTSVGWAQGTLTGCSSIGGNQSNQGEIGTFPNFYRLLVIDY